jgi:hypothetical protein
MKLAAGLDAYLARPELLLGLQVAAATYEAFGRELLVTSIFRSGPGTLLHGRGLAADLRLPSRSERAAGAPELEDLDQRVADALRLALGGPKPGGQWDVLLELGPEASVHWTGAHIHIEYDPVQHPEVKAGLVATT